MPGPRRAFAVVRALPIVVPALAAVALVALALGWSPRSAPDPLIVADLRGHALVVLDPSAPEAARRIDLPGGPHELLRLPDGRVLVSLEQYGALALVDVGSGDVERIEVGGNPHGLALDGDAVLVTDRSVEQVRRFALDDWRELDPLPSSHWPHAVAVTPSGAVAVTSAEPGTVRVGDEETFVGRTTETLAVRGDGAIAAAAATDGVVVLIAEAADSVPFVVATNQAAQDVGVRANDLVGLVAAALGGRGGGKADLAQGSGKNSGGIDAALSAVRAELARG